MRKSSIRIARGGRGGDAPARGGRTCGVPARTQKGERGGRSRCSEVEAPGRGEIDAARDGAGHHGDVALRLQSFLDSPEGIHVLARLHENELADIEAELAQAVSVGMPEVAQCPPRHDQHRGAFASLLGNGKQGEGEAESGRTIGIISRYFVENARRKPVAREMRVQIAERQGRLRKCRPRGGLEAGDGFSQLCKPSLLRRRRLGGRRTPGGVRRSIGFGSNRVRTRPRPGALDRLREQGGRCPPRTVQHARQDALGLVASRPSCSGDARVATNFTHIFQHGVGVDASGLGQLPAFRTVSKHPAFIRTK